MSVLNLIQLNRTKDTVDEILYRVGRQCGGSDDSLNRYSNSGGMGGSRDGLLGCSSLRGSHNSLVNNQRRHSTSSSSYLRFNEPSIIDMDRQQRRRGSSYQLMSTSPPQSELERQQLLGMDPRYRDNRPIVNCTTSCWDMSVGNPSIFIEDYGNDCDEDRGVEQRQQTQQQGEEENNEEHEDEEDDDDDEETKEECDTNDELEEDECGDRGGGVVCADCDEYDNQNDIERVSCINLDDIPFIDDENSGSPPPFRPPPDPEPINNNSHKGGIMIDKNRRNSSGICGNRKTVSFDTIKTTKNNLCDDDDYDDRIRGAIGGDDEDVLINKSKTYENFMDQKINEPIFKFCKKKPLPLNNKTKEKISLYFNNDDDDVNDEDNDENGEKRIKQRNENGAKKQFDMSEIELDLSGIVTSSADSTTCSSGNNQNYHNTEVIYEDQGLLDGGHTFDYNKDNDENNSMMFCDGKVKALKNYFDSFNDGRKIRPLEFPVPYQSKLSRSTPNLGVKLDSNKLNENEQSVVMRQLKDWSKYGSYATTSVPPLIQAKSSYGNNNNSTTLDYNNLNKLLNRIDKTDKVSCTCSRSTPNLSNFHQIDDDIVRRNPIPDAFIVTKLKNKKRNCFQKHRITDRFYEIYGQSCPNLLEREEIVPKIDITPMHSSTNQLTLKQIKNNRKKKIESEKNHFDYGFTG